jgi:23S rRNA (cytosine1962-C5)-methyltransferase
LVIQSNTAGIDRVLPLLSETLVRLIEKEMDASVKSIVWRQDANIRTLEGVPMSSRAEKGDEADLHRWFFRESDLAYCADLLDGQKTGFFLDQRENRNFLEEWTKKRPTGRVLDLFCYSGGWGFRALKSGAASVTFVDQSKPALGLVKAGAERNKFAADRYQTVAADVFDYLSEPSEPFDVVVADPPAFVKTKKDLPQGQKAYERLTRAAWRRIKPGGLLLISSCSFHLSEPDFLDLLRDSVGREPGLAHLVYRGRQGADHPMLLSMPETRYLKCLGLSKAASWIPPEAPAAE